MFFILSTLGFYGKENKKNVYNNDRITGYKDII